MENPAQLLLDIWRMFKRRFWIMGLVSGFGVAIAAFVAYVMPPVYQSKATILVESQQIPNDLARSTITTGAAERLEFIKQRMMTRDNLLSVIEDLDLYEDRDDLTVSQKISNLRNATKVTSISLADERRKRGRAGQRISAFSISVTYHDAQKAAQIANEFVTTTLNQNLRARTERASDTLEFFVIEEERLSRELTELEARLTRFKNENAASLPGNVQQRRDALSRIEETQFNLEQRALVLEEERSALIIRLTQIEKTGSVDAPETAQLRQLELQLNQRLAVYTETHREVRRIRAQISALKATMAQNANRDDEETEEEEFRSVEEQIMERKVKFIDTQIEVLNDQKLALEQRKLAIEESIAEAPQIEVQMAALARQRTELAEQLARASKKRAEAETGEKLEVNQQAERFEVIENALAPDRPTSPNRGKILAMGSGFAIAVAVGLGLLLEFLNPALRTASAMERRLELRPVATIPYIRTTQERNRTRIRYAALFILVAIGLPLAIFAIDTYYQPIHVLGGKLLDQSGLGGFVRILEQRF